MPTISTHDRINQTCLILISAVMMTIALIYTKAALVPFVLALFIHTVISSATDYLNKKIKFPQIFNLILVFLILIVVTVSIVYMVTISLENFFAGAFKYKQKIYLAIEEVAAFAERFGYSIESSVLKAQISEMPVFSMAKQLTGSVAGIVGNTLLIAVFVMFLIIGEATSKEEGTSLSILTEIRSKVSRYLATKFLMSVITGILFGVLLAFFSIELTLMFALLTVLLNFIPNIGSLIATLLPVPVILLQYGLGWELVFIVTVAIVINFVIGSIIEPRLMGESMDLHPVTILMFLIFWGLVWGPVGMFLAVPITAILKISLSKIPTTARFAEALAGRIS